jgi:transposase
VGAAAEDGAGARAAVADRPEVRRGRHDRRVAAELDVSRDAVSKWRSRFLRGRLEGLTDEPRPGRPRTVSDKQVGAVITATLEQAPASGDTHWSTRSMARSAGPGRTAPCLPMLPATPARMTRDYVRNGTTSLFAAFDLSSGPVIAQSCRRHRHWEFLRFLKLIDAAVPKDLDLHLVLDNYATHKTPEIHRWLLRRPRFHLHFTPASSSWLNLVSGTLVRRAHQPEAPQVRPPQRHRARSRHPHVDQRVE